MAKRGRGRRDIYFPDHIIREVLSRLPVKTLLRFRNVCKAWRSLIDSQEFATQHLICYNSVDRLKLAHLLVVENITTQNSSPDFKHSLCRSRDFSVVEDFGLSESAHNLSIGFYDVAGYANGVLCFTVHSFNLQLKNIGLVNPSMLKHTSIPLPPMANGESGPWIYVSLLFGYDLARQHYKVLAMGSRYRERSWGTYGFDELPIVFEIYAKSGDSYSWKSIVDTGIGHTKYLVSSLRDAKVFLNGSVHLIGYNDNKPHIVVFDMNNEKFGHMELPYREDTDKEVYRSCSPLVYGELLGLIEVRKSDTIIWVMIEYGNKESWMTQYKLKTSMSAAHEFLYLKKDFELFHQDFRYNSLKGFNLEKKFNHFISRKYGCPKYINTFVESLMSFDAK